MCYAIRVFTEDEYKDIEKRINALNTDKEKKKKMAILADEVESELVLLGCTAVEDKLQDNVPKVIADFI